MISSEETEKGAPFSISSEMKTNGVDETEKIKKKKTMTTKKIKILASVVYGNLFLGSCYSLMAPIFPAEAERKNASATSYGLVFGVYQLVMFISAPIYGKIIIVLRPGFLMKVGMFVSGICVILFGFLHYAPPGTPFIALAIAIRSVDALGAAAYVTASYATIGCELPEFIGRAMALTETAFAVGLAGGPVLGGFLFEVGGFSLPFNVVGALLLTGTVMNVFLFTDTNDIPHHSTSARKLLANPDFLIDILVVSTCFASLGFNEATLEPHIRQFQLSPTTIGLIFLIEGIVDALFSPVWGYFAEKISNAQYLTVLATILLIAYFLIIGPVPFLNFGTYISVIVCAQLLMGLGMGGEIVCSFTHGMQHTVEERGFPDDVGTYGLVSGVLFSASCFGAFFGPSVGGLLIDHIGYTHAIGVVAALKTVVAVICILRLSVLYYRKRKVPELEKDTPKV